MSASPGAGGGQTRASCSPRPAAATAVLRPAPARSTATQTRPGQRLQSTRRWGACVRASSRGPTRITSAHMQLALAWAPPPTYRLQARTLGRLRPIRAHARAACERVRSRPGRTYGALVTRSSQGGHGSVTSQRGQRCMMPRDGGTRQWAGLVKPRAPLAERTEPRRAHRTGREARPAPFAITLVATMSSPFGFLLASDPPSRRVGAIVALVAVALCTLIVYPLKHVAPVVSLSVVYLPAVLVVSVTWGAWLGCRHGGAQRGGVQLLSPAAGRRVHDPGLEQLGRAGRVPRGRGARELASPRSRARAPATPRSAGARPTWRRRWRGCCCAGTASPRRCRRPRRGWRRRSS